MRFEGENIEIGRFSAFIEDPFPSQAGHSEV
jgi:hypothetical protein